jgi:hypothetical protein
MAEVSAKLRYCLQLVLLVGRRVEVRMIGFRVRAAILALAVLVLTGCATVIPRTDLMRLYATQAGNPDQPPVVIVHGALGSRLQDPVTGRCGSRSTPTR